VYNKVFVWTAVQAHDLKFDQKRSPDDWGDLGGTWWWCKWSLQAAATKHHLNSHQSKKS